MTDTIILGASILAPVILLTLLRVDGAVAFMSLCLGYVLEQFVSKDAISLLTTIYPHAGNVSQSTLEIILLCLPLALTIIVMFHSVKKSGVILNILPAIGVGVLGLILVEPLLSPGIQGSLSSSSWWNQFQQAQTLAVSVTALISLAFLWMQRRSGKSDHKKKHSKG